MVLWVILACITACVVVAIISPLYRKSAELPANAQEIELYKAQLREVEADVRRNVLGKAEARDVSLEISRRLLAASDEKNRSSNQMKFGSANAVTAVIALAITSVSLVIYLSAGSPQMPGQPLSARLQSPAEANKIEAMIAKVEARLRTHPDDASGWNVIAPVYLRQQRFDDAAEAYRKAIALGGETPERLAGYGEASVLANDGVATALARSALQKAIQQRPDILRARFFLALADENQGDKAAARDGYQALLKAELNPDWRRAIESKLAALDGKPPSSEQALADPAARQQMIEGMVAGLADRLTKNGGEVEEWLRLARAYTVLGKKEDAVATVEKAMSQYTGNLDALKKINDFAVSFGLKS